MNLPPVRLSFAFALVQLTSACFQCQVASICTAYQEDAVCSNGCCCLPEDNCNISTSSTTTTSSTTSTSTTSSTTTTSTTPTTTSSPSTTTTSTTPTTTRFIPPTTTPPITTTTAASCGRGGSQPSVNCNDVSPNCPHWHSNGFCDSQHYTCDQKRQYCAKTCGFCTPMFTTTTAPVVRPCVDRINPATGTSDCPFRTEYCNNSVYYNLMTEQCPKTCGRCPGGIGTWVPSPAPSPVSSCVDKLNPATGTSDCPFRTEYCNNSVYYKLMTEQCPRTCGRCSGKK